MRASELEVWSRVRLSGQIADDNHGTKSMDRNTNPTITEGEPCDENSIRVEFFNNGDEWFPVFPVPLTDTEGLNDVLEPWLRDRLNPPETLEAAKADDRVHIGPRNRWQTGLKRASFRDDVAVAEYRDEYKEWIVKTLV